MIITVFGAGGVGKTSTVKVIANMMEANGKSCTIIDCESRFGAFQRNINQSVPLDQSLKKAVLDTQNINLYENYWDNVSYFSMADEEGIDSYLASNEGMLISFIEALKETYDIIIFDCTQNIKDDLTAFAMKYADVIINLITSSVQGLAFENAHKPLYKLLNKKKINILNKNLANNLNNSTAEAIIGEKINLVIPFHIQILESNLSLEDHPKFSNRIKKILPLLEESDGGVKQERKSSFLQRFKR